MPQTTICADSLDIQDMAENCIYDYGPSVAIAMILCDIMDMDYAVDSCGLSSRSRIVSDEEQSELLIYPNPVSGQLFLEGLTLGEYFRIYDVNGRLLLENKFDGLPININSLNQGLYILASERDSKKFLVQ